MEERRHAWLGCLWNSTKYSRNCNLLLIQVWCGLMITGELTAVKQAEISSIDMEKANKEYEKVPQVQLLKSLHHNNIVG